MPEYAVTITHIYNLTARNEEQAEERAQDLENALGIKNLKVRWQWDMDSSECQVDEI